MTASIQTNVLIIVVYACVNRATKTLTGFQQISLKSPSRSRNKYEYVVDIPHADEATCT